MHIQYAPTFVRQFKTLDIALQDEAVEKIELFKNLQNHKQLKVHKLQGRLSGRYSFSVNYQFRIVFIYSTKTIATLLAIGDHDVYR